MQESVVPAQQAPTPVRETAININNSEPATAPRPRIHTGYRPRECPISRRCTNIIAAAVILYIASTFIPFPR